MRKIIFALGILLSGSVLAGEDWIVRCRPVQDVIPDLREVRLVQLPEAGEYERLEVSVSGELRRHIVPADAWERLRVIPLTDRPHIKRMLVESPSDLQWYYQEFNLKGEPLRGAMVPGCETRL